MNAEIIAVGSELLTPFRHDTNSLYLTEQLNRLGVEVLFKSIVGDNRQHLTQAALMALTRANIIICTGGLGPTEDDRTRESIADALGLELRRDAEALRSLERRFAERGYAMTPNNSKQADVIAGATILENRNGSAPGQWISGRYGGQERLILLLPGPPHEMKAVFDEQCRERLRAKLPQQFIASRVLKIAGLGESACDARVAPIYTRHAEVETTILAGAGEIQLHLRSRANSMASAEERVEALVEQIENELGDNVISDNGDSMEQILGYYLQMRNATLAVAESCTGGLLAERITSVAGSSRYFLGGSVAYANSLKTALAGVPAELIARHTAVSPQVALALAAGIRERCGSSWGIGITGIAGPGGGTIEKPVGLVFLALAGRDGSEAVERRFSGDRNRIRLYAVQQAMDMLRRKLM